MSSNGSEGNCINFDDMKDIEFEPFDGTVEEAKKALKEAKKNTKIKMDYVCSKE